MSEGGTAPIRFRRNREEVAWLVFVLVVSGAFAVTAGFVYVRRLAEEARTGRFDLAFDALWGAAALALLGLLAYYVVVVVRFVRSVVSADETGLSVGGTRVLWSDVQALREEIIRKRSHVFRRLEIERRDGSWFAVTTAHVDDFDALRRKVAESLPHVAIAVREDAPVV